MRLVILESPFGGDVSRNKRYLRACILDCLQRGESPYASHAILPKALDDTRPEERFIGINAGFAWRVKSDATVVYEDLGISAGMQLGIDHAISILHPIEYRRLGAVWAKEQKAHRRRELQQELADAGDRRDAQEADAIDQQLAILDDTCYPDGACEEHGRCWTHSFAQDDEVVTVNHPYITAKIVSILDDKPEARVEYPGSSRDCPFATLPLKDLRHKGWMP